MKQLSLVFFGSPNNSAQLLNILIKDRRFKIVAAVTQPDRPIGRKKIVTATPVAKTAIKYNLPVFKPERVYLLSFPEQAGKIDLILSYEYGQLIPSKLLNMAKYGGLNIHFSLLPSYRGASPLPWQILNGEKQTGISFSKMAADFDTGDSIYQEAHDIKKEDTTITLNARLSQKVLDITTNILLNYAGGSLKKPNLGNHVESYCPRMKREDGYIDYLEFKNAMDGNLKLSEKIMRMLRAFNPWPGVYTLVSGKRLKILGGKIDGNKFIPVKIQWESQEPINI